MGDFEVLEHTADVGVRATGATLEEAFEQATLGLADIVGIWRPAPGDDVAIDLSGADPGGLLVDWLNEILYLHDTRGAAFGGVKVDEVTDSRVRGTITLAPLGEDLAEGVQVKAVTYHQLVVERADGGWAAQVFFDV